MEKSIAKDLLSIGAVFLRPEQPFTWASGIKSPVYCDNRLTLTAPQVRADVENGLATLIKTHYPEAKRLFMLGTPSMITEFEKAGFESATDSADDRPDVLVVAFDKTLAYDRLCRAAWWISQGVPYIATNPDRVCPTDQPVVLVDCGSICACLTHATGRTPDITLGKPDPNMLSGILNRYGMEPDEVAMVGDRIYTDIEMAHNAGAFGVLVLSGETTLEVADAAPKQPHLICDSIEVLGELIAQAHKE